MSEQTVPEASEPQPGPTADERPEARLERAVRAAEQALIEFEIAVETFRVEVENFSRLHHQKLGPMYSRLDELDALIAEAKAARTGDAEDLRRARDARSLVMPMPGVDELFHDWLDSDGISDDASAMLTDRAVRPRSGSARRRRCAASTASWSARRIRTWPATRPSARGARSSSCG